MNFMKDWNSQKCRTEMLYSYSILIRYNFPVTLVDYVELTKFCLMEKTSWLALTLYEAKYSFCICTLVLWFTKNKKLKNEIH